MRPRRSIGALAGLLVVLLLTACSPDPVPLAMADAPPAPTTTVAPRVVSPEDPLRVVMMGDSVAGEVKLPIEYALVEGGSTRFRYELVPSLPRTPRARRAWDAVLREEDPDLVIVLVGYWEAAVLRRANSGALPPADRYHRRQLVPFVDRATASGAEVLWIGMPPPRDPAGADDFVELDRRFAALADEDDRVGYVAGEELLAGPAGGFTDVLTGPDGTERVRWADGLHVCPDGSVRIARPVLDQIVGRWDVPITAEWPDAGWRNAPFAGWPGLPSTLRRHALRSRRRCRTTARSRWTSTPSTRGDAWPMVEVRPANGGDRRALSTLLGRAFVDDPAWAWVYPQPDRDRRLARMYRSLLGAVGRRGATVLTDTEQRGAAIWQRDGERELGTIGNLTMGVAMVRSGADLRRCQALARVLEEHHPTEPHWYLTTVGADPAHQGAGIGSALVRHVVEDPTEGGVAAYLEVLTEANLGFYRRFGFEEIGAFDVPDGGPHVWQLWRDPVEISPREATRRG